MRRTSLLLILALLSCSGKDHIPKEILKPAKMEPVLWDYMRADVYTSGFYKGDSTSSDTLQNLRMQEAIFKKYKISRKQFEQSLSYYLNHSELLSPLADSIAAHHKSESKSKIQLKTDSLKINRIHKISGTKTNE